MINKISLILSKILIMKFDNWINAFFSHSKIQRLINCKHVSKNFLFLLIRGCQGIKTRSLVRKVVDIHLGHPLIRESIENRWRRTVIRTDQSSSRLPALVQQWTSRIAPSLRLPWTTQSCGESLSLRNLPQDPQMRIQVFLQDKVRLTPRHLCLPLPLAHIPIHHPSTKTPHWTTHRKLRPHRR